jgi:hypothetical protein
VPNGPEFNRCPGANVGIVWRPKFNVSCPSTHRIASRLAKFCLVGAGLRALRRLAVGQLLPPHLIAVLRDLALDAVQHLLQHHLAVTDNRNVDVTCCGGDLDRIDVDTCDLRVAAKPRRRGMPDDVVHPRAKHDDQVGIRERRVAHRQERARMIVRHDAAALRRGVERDARSLDELLHLAPRLRPDHAGA